MVMCFLLAPHLPRFFGRVKYTQSLHLFILIFNFYCYCFHSMDILKFNNCECFFIDFFSFRVISLSFLMMTGYLFI